MFSQAVVVFKKNLLCTIRNKGECFKELLVPLLSGLILYGTSYNKKRKRIKKKNYKGINNMFFVFKRIIHVKILINKIIKRYYAVFFPPYGSYLSTYGCHGVQS